MCSYWLRTWPHTCTLHLHTPFAYAIITKTSYAFFAKITLCIFYPMTPFAHAFAYAIKKTPYAFFAKITLCMYILCVIIVCYSTKIRYCKLRTQRVREMAALERIDMLRQLIEMFRRANFSENTSLRGNVVIQ